MAKLEFAFKTPGNGTLHTEGDHNALGIGRN